MQIRKTHPITYMSKRQWQHAHRAINAAIMVAGGSQKALGELVAKKIRREKPFSSEAVAQWLKNGVTAERAVDIERATGISRADLRPDIFEGFEPVRKAG